MLVALSNTAVHEIMQDIISGNFRKASPNKLEARLGHDRTFD